MDKGLTVLKWVLINWLKITQMSQNLSVQIVCPSPNVWDFAEKRLYCNLFCTTEVEINNPNRAYNWFRLLDSILLLVWNTVGATNKRTDVWSRDFIIWKINSGLRAVVWAGLWNKRVWTLGRLWATFEAIFFAFLGSKFFLRFFLKTL